MISNNELCFKGKHPPLGSISKLCYGKVRPGFLADAFENTLPASPSLRQKAGFPDGGGMKIDIKTSLQGRPAIAFSLRQALEILQMPQQELGQWLLSEIVRNPLLELNRSSQPTYAKDAAQIEAPRTLHDHLMSQIRERCPLPAERNLAIHLLEHLDERGYLSPCPEEVPLDTLLPILQSFDPPGIFARDLRECLLLQLQPETPAYGIVSRCFKDLLHGRFETIKKKTGLSDLAPAIQALSRLTLRPADLFKKEVAAPAIADLSISKIGRTWIVETREDELPELSIRADYLALCPESPEEKRSLRSWIASAKWLLRSLKRRRLVLLEIGAFLVRKQAAYLEQKGSLQPLTLQELSQHLRLHESTLSRALSGKHALTPRGFLPLRALLSSAPVADGAKQALQKLIAQEDKQNPLNDAEIVARLKETGLTLARRTIAKYRKNLKIGSASRRKHC